MPALRQSEAEFAAALQRLTLARGELENEQQRIATARSEAETRLRQIGDDIGRESALAEEAGETAGRLSVERASIEQAQAGENEREAEAAALLAAVNRTADDLEAQVAGLTETIATTEARRASLQRQVNLAVERHERLQRQLESLDRQCQELRDRTVAPDQLEAANLATESANERLHAAGLAVDTAEAAKVTRSAALEAARGAFQKIEAERTKLGAEAGALKDMLAAETPGGLAPVIDQIAVEAGYEGALGASLGDDLTAPLGSPENSDAQRRWSGGVSSATGPALPDGARPLIEAVKGPAELTRRLSQIGVAGDAETAARLQTGLAQGQRLTTREGGLWRWDGYVVAVDAPSAAAVRMRQRNRLREIDAAIETLAGRRTDAEAALAVARTALAEIDAREKQGRLDQRAAFSALDGARKRHAELQGRLAEIDSKLAAIEENRLRIETDQAESLDQKAVAASELTELQDVEALRAESAGIRRALSDCRTELADARSAYDQLVRESQARRSRLGAIVSEQTSWADRIERATARMRELEGRHDSEAVEIERLAARPAEIAEQRVTLVTAIETAEGERLRAAEGLAAAEAVLSQADQASRAADLAVASAREARVRAESGLEQVNQSLSSLRERITERLECAPDEILQNAEIDPNEALPDIDSTEARLERLTRERERIGPVNLRAEQEVAELEQQIAGMENERDDLVGAIARLRRAIASLNREGRDRLLAAFEVVNRHFQDLFVRLFGGGRAHLTLVEADDPLDTGLEIMASPPGKKLQMMSLLSGGEQALTALALVFAAFLTSPSPICVLDEVDAPLDDSNVDRFCTLLSDIARTTGTRFLIITHHCLTMARMDRLFGVTMAEQGVSQLVSVDLQGAAQLRESA